MLDEQATVTLSDSFEWNEELNSCVLISTTSPSTSFKYVLKLSSLQVGDIDSYLDLDVCRLSP